MDIVFGADGDGRALKAEVARVLVLKFPELRVFLTRDGAYKERFHQNIFDAVAPGILVISVVFEQPATVRALHFSSS